MNNPLRKVTVIQNQTEVIKLYRKCRLLQTSTEISSTYLVSRTTGVVDADGYITGQLKVTENGC
jgi:hypothetical protein